MSHEKPQRTRSPGRGPAMTARMAEAARNRAAAFTSPRWSGQRNDHAVVGSAMWGKGMPAIPRPQENEGVGEHVRTRFHFDREATREIAEPENRPRTERRKLVSSAGPQNRTVRPLT